MALITTRVSFQPVDLYREVKLVDRRRWGWLVDPELDL